MFFINTNIFHSNFYWIVNIRYFKQKQIVAQKTYKINLTKLSSKIMLTFLALYIFTEINCGRENRWNIQFIGYSKKLSKFTE